jgi:hypothetical protein
VVVVVVLVAMMLMRSIMVGLMEVTTTVAGAVAEEGDMD